jgi:hypothetical protein
MSLPVIQNMEDLPELGTSEASVQSVVCLIAGMTGKTEALIAYWLDLYYFVRSAYEREKNPGPPACPLCSDDAYAVFRKVWNSFRKPPEADMAEEPQEQAAGSGVKEDAGAERSAPPLKPPA